MLVLFDIDGTLLLSHGAGMQCFLQAGSTLFAREFRHDGLRFGGGLDPLIWRALCAANGVTDEDAHSHHERFRELYGRLLGERLAQPATAYALPGVTALLDALTERTHVTVGLLTGNYPETGRAKLAAAGLPPQRFAVSAWGVDGNHRRELLPVALRRCEEHTGRVPPREQVVVVGDTPHDVDCAAAHGCRSLAVATGHHGVEELAACGASLAVPDLSDTQRVVSWLGC